MRQDAPSLDPDPVLRDDLGYHDITSRVLSPLWSKPSLPFRFFFLMTGMGALGFVGAMAYTIFSGIGVWGNNIPVAWAFAIINFVWWIGLGHAGTFISAFLLLLEQQWRSSINRVAEAMTLFAIAMAMLFPVLHLGRAWFAYWLLPYPATMGVWPQFRSSLPYDAAAIATYGIVSLLFWYLGLIPDLASARDAAPTRRRARIYGIFALGWRGAARDWRRYQIGYGLLAGLATPLVVSVHSIVSMDFAIAQLPGWHSTIFPPYFVVGAIHSGLALVAMLLIPIRSLMGWKEMITRRHLDMIAKLLLVMGSLMLYAYLMESFMAWYSGHPVERFIYLVHRPLEWPVIYWATVILNGLVPQVFWSRRARHSRVVLFGASTLVLAGMWIERFLIVVTSLDRDFLPSSWHEYMPTWVDWSLLLGSMSTFLFLFLLFLRFVPGIPIHEVKQLAHERDRDLWARP